MNRSPRFFLAPLAIAAASLSIPGNLAAQAPGIPPLTSVANAALGGQELPPYLQCVPYAREVSGIEIFGDAHTWWVQAAGRYERGTKPRVGAVMAFMPYQGMELGHVAAVSQIVDSRTVLLDHANWSPINGRRGQIERGVRAVDVSPANDWSQVRVWYHPLQALGTTAWPVRGFIYPDGNAKPRPQPRLVQAVAPQPTREEPSNAFLAAFSAATPPRQAASPMQPRPRVAQASYAQAQPLTPPRQGRATMRSGNRGGSDAVERAVSLYD